MMMENWNLTCAYCVFWVCVWWQTTPSVAAFVWFFIVVVVVHWTSATYSAILTFTSLFYVNVLINLFFRFYLYISTEIFCFRSSFTVSFMVISVNGKYCKYNTDDHFHWANFFCSVAVWTWLLSNMELSVSACTVQYWNRGRVLLHWETCVLI